MHCYMNYVQNLLFLYCEIHCPWSKSWVFIWLGGWQILLEFRISILTQKGRLVQNWYLLTAQSMGYGTQVTVKACRPHVFMLIICVKFCYIVFHFFFISWTKTITFIQPLTYNQIYMYLIGPVMIIGIQHWSN